VYDPRYQDAVKVAADRIKKVSRLTWVDGEAQFLRPAPQALLLQVSLLVGTSVCPLDGRKIDADRIYFRGIRRGTVVSGLGHVDSW
jgi:hypothetical protein